MGRMCQPPTTIKNTKGILPMNNIIKTMNRHRTVNRRLRTLQHEQFEAINQLREFREHMLDLTYTKEVEDQYMGLVATAEDITKDIAELLNALMNSPLQN